MSQLKFLESETNLIYIGMLACILSAIPIWLIPIAPLSDWPVHLAIASQIHQLLSGTISNYYSLDFSVLGYSGLHLLLAFLYNFVPLEIAGKLVLTLLFVLTPVCWWFFISTLDPKKKILFIFGSLFLYSVFFSFGLINFLFAVNFGLVFLAIGINSFLNGKENSPGLLISGLLCFLFHEPVFLIASAVLLIAYFCRKFVLGIKMKEFGILLILTMFILALLDSSTQPAFLDGSYQSDSSQCAQKLQFLSKPPNYSMSEFQKLMLANFMGMHINPFEIFDTVFPLKILFYSSILLGSVIIAVFFWHCIKNRKPLASCAKERLKNFLFLANKNSYNLAFLSLAGIMLAYYIIMPSCAVFCLLNLRSLPFFFAFLLISFKGEKYVRLAFFLILFLFVANILFQGWAFYSETAIQSSIVHSIENVSSSIPAGSKVFVIPSYWNDPVKYNWYPIYQNPHYHALLLAKNPSIYVSGLYLSSNAYVLRSNSKIYDELYVFPMYSEFDSNISSCFCNLPAYYDFVIYENLKLVSRSDFEKSCKLKSA